MKVNGMLIELCILLFQQQMLVLLCILPLFPSKKRTLAGSISQFLTDKNTTLLQQWDTDATLTLKAGNGTGSSFRGFSFGCNCAVLQTE